MEFTTALDQLLVGAASQQKNLKLQQAAASTLVKGYIALIDLVATCESMGLEANQLVSVMGGLLNSADADYLAQALEKGSGRLRKQADGYAQLALATADSGSKGAVEQLLYQLEQTTVGVKAADIVAKDIQGNPVHLSEHRGKYLMLDFWNTGCGPCIKAMPHHAQMQQQFSGKPFELITIATDEALDDVKELMEEVEMPFTNWHLPGASDRHTLDTWRINVFPTVMIVDPKGTILARGILWDQQLDRYLEQLLNTGS